MPRKFSKDYFLEEEPSEMIGFDRIGFDSLSSRKISEAIQKEEEPELQTYTHRNVFSGLPCSCGYWHPEEKQTKIAGYETPNILVVMGTRDDALREKLFDWLKRHGYGWTSSLSTADAALAVDPVQEQQEKLDSRNIAAVNLEYSKARLIGEESSYGDAGKEFPSQFPSLKRKLDQAIEQTAGEQEGFVPNLKTNTGRKILKQNQKIFRRGGPFSGDVPNSQSQGGENAGLKVLERLDNLCASYDAEGLLPWLVARLAKNDITPNFGAKGSFARGDSIGLMHGTQNMDHLFERIATWFNARQSPFRQGKNVMELNVDQAADLATEHLEWVQSQEMVKQYSEQLLEDEMAKRKEDELQRANTPPDEPYSPMVVDLPQAIEARNLELMDGVEDADLEAALLDPKKYKGWRAVKITSDEDAVLETAILGHCIGSDAQPYVYGIDAGVVNCFSLRDSYGIPKVTWHWNPDDSLGHIQGKSGYPKDEWRELISAVNDFLGRDDDGGGGGDDHMAQAVADHDGDYFYNNGMENFLESDIWREAEGISHWDFGEVSNIERLVDIIEEPWEVVSEDSGGERISEDCDLDATPIISELAEDAAENYDSYPEKLIEHLSGSLLYGMRLDDLIKGILEYWQNTYDEMQIEDGFDDDAFRDEVANGNIDERFLNLVWLKTLPGQDLTSGEYGIDRSPTSQGRPNIFRFPSLTAEDYTVPSSIPPSSQRPSTPFGPFGNKLPLTEDQIVTQYDYRGTQRDIPYGQVVGDPVTIEPRNNPADIAKEYARIWTNEGQSAANKWYYENYPDAQPVNQQLTSGWNGLMRSRGL